MIRGRLRGSCSYRRRSVAARQHGSGWIVDGREEKGMMSCPLRMGRNLTWFLRRYTKPLPDGTMAVFCVCWFLPGQHHRYYAQKDITDVAVCLYATSNNCHL